jgi:hypothetical protein
MISPMSNDGSRSSNLPIVIISSVLITFEIGRRLGFDTTVLTWVLVGSMFAAFCYAHSIWRVNHSRQAHR